MSQFISNIPMVELYLTLLSNTEATTKEMIALAVGSTIAGNVTILGAASNVIIIQNAEKKSNQTVTFFDFIKIGISLAILSIVVYWFFFYIMN